MFGSRSNRDGRCRRLWPRWRAVDVVRDQAEPSLGWATSASVSACAPSIEVMRGLDLSAMLQVARGADPDSVPQIVRELAGRLLNASDVVLYLVDFAQVSLEPVPDPAAHATAPPASETVLGTMAGRAFLTQRPVLAGREDGVRVWVPVIEGSDRTGVLALTVPSSTDETVQACTDLGLLTGYLIAVNTKATDVYNVRRRRRSLSLAASLQWDLLPPLVLRTDRVVIAGLVEPAYEVGGDCFDYAVNGSTCDVAVFDAMGHNLRSAMIAALAVGSCRHSRREGHTLEMMHRELDRALAAEFQDLSFATGQLARIDLHTGFFTFTNAGHPLPLLVRNGQVVRALSCRPTLPWGLNGLLGQPLNVTTAMEPLEPGDSILFYSDGVIDAHSQSGDTFGVIGLADFVGRSASNELEPEQVVRQLTRAVLEHHENTLSDDATFVLVQWSGTN